VRNGGGGQPLNWIVSLHANIISYSTAVPKSSSSPPNNLPTYRLLTGPDDAEFCRRVSEAIALGYVLYGSPAATFNGTRVIVAQALIWPSSSGSPRTASRDSRNPSERRRKRAG